MLGAVAVILLSALLLLPFASFPYAVYALVFIWGVAIVIVSLGMVSKVLAFASDATDVANSIYSGLYNVGIGGGALLGHYVTVWFGSFQYRHCRSLAGGGRFGRLRLVV